ncbi:sugar ABC transporter substrate-binding protein [Streptomyces scabrisporus]|uniref:substrate-binding domain-containing protein n=1 Tax=Embleya scabrispora TaxID=159449 RepID=UPI00036F78F0
MMRRHGPVRGAVGRATIAAAVASLIAGLAACGTLEPAAAPSGGDSGTGGFSVGLLLPDTHTARWATADRPLIQTKVEELCPDCVVKYANASGDVATQQQQMDSMIANGVRALILDPVDYKALRPSITRAHDAGIPVVSYDRLAEGPISAYSGYDSEQIGRLQAEALLTAMGNGTHEPQIVMMNGDPTDPNTTALQRGALSVFKGRAKIVKSYYTGGWIPQNAFTNMSAAIAEVGPDRLDGVYSANDGLAFGVLTALRAAGIKPLPPITGQDANREAVQRIVAGQQYVTVYKSFVSEADAAAEMALALGRGASIDAIAKDRVGNDTSNAIPAVLGPLTPVTVDTIESTLVENGVYTIAQICTPELRAACREAGLTT